ncbi:PEP-CTERM sorting domain-containing protein [Lentimonas sp. CC10]|nr:PEP-CTERM sorting domain-containing protein [Lentimonas sp. CC10]CAA6697036.1 Unannotated [Lentimonas sp. CC10]CAA7070577.1 Unannotated [Lentimonas sp. CC11]
MKIKNLRNSLLAVTSLLLATGVAHSQVEVITSPTTSGSATSSGGAFGSTALFGGGGAVPFVGIATFDLSVTGFTIAQLTGASFTVEYDLSVANGSAAGKTYAVDLLGTFDSGANSGSYYSAAGTTIVGPIAVAAGTDLTASGTLGTPDEADDFAVFRFRDPTAVGGAINQFLASNISLSVTAVPEPSSYALLAGCLALTSVMVRRRAA